MSINEEGGEYDNESFGVCSFVLHDSVKLRTERKGLFFVAILHATNADRKWQSRRHS